MSALAGVIQFDGEPLSSDTLPRLAEALGWRAPDGMGSWEAHGVGLVYGHHWSTPEDVGSRQPLASPEGRFHLVADARIDNREQLLAQLAAAGAAVAPDASDAHIILAAWQAWGEACVPRLLGDFAFALWDQSERRLILARDVLGIRQLYYYQQQRTLVFATTLGALLSILPNLPPLNRPLLEEFLRSYYRRWVRETPYQGIERLPPAHLLQVTASGSAERLYYTLGSEPPASFRSEAEWAEAFALLLEEAVRCRLRSRTPVGIITGGGLDSSAIACLAKQVVARNSNLPPVQLHAAYHSDTAADERRYFDAVADYCPSFAATRVPADDQWAFREYGTDAGFPLDEPELYPLRAHTLALLRSAAGQGAGVVLMGEGANQVLGHSVYYQPAALLGVPWRWLPQEFPYYRRAAAGSLSRVLFHALLRPLLSDRVMECLRPLRPGDAEWPDWVLRERGPVPPPAPLPREFVSPPGLTWSARQAHQALRSAFDLARLAALDMTGAYAGLEIRFPFLDRRVVEFLLAMPPTLRSWAGEDRRILRQSMRGRMPEVIRERRDKASMLGLIHTGLHQKARQRVEALLEESIAARLGFIRPDLLRRSLEAYWSGANNREYRFLSALALEAWLRSLPKSDIIKCGR